MNGDIPSPLFSPAVTLTGRLMAGVSWLATREVASNPPKSPEERLPSGVEDAQRDAA